MLKSILSLPQILHIPNIWKGGDFMGIEAKPSVILATTPEPKSVTGLRNTSFPERNGRTRFDTAMETARTIEPNRPLSVLGSITEMDAVSDRTQSDQ